MIGTVTKESTEKKSVCKFPDKRSPKGMFENLVDF